jgi:hypothetical protein
MPFTIGFVVWTSFVFVSAIALSTAFYVSLRNSAERAFGGRFREYAGGLLTQIPAIAITLASFGGIYDYVISPLYVPPTKHGLVLVGHTADGGVTVTPAPYGVFRYGTEGASIRNSLLGSRVCTDTFGTVTRIEGNAIPASIVACAKVSDLTALYGGNPEATMDMVASVLNAATLETLVDPSWPKIVAGTMARNTLAEDEANALLAKHYLALRGVTVEFSKLQVPDVL